MPRSATPSHHDITRFKTKFVEGAATECWHWLGGTFPAGYGAFWFQGFTGRAHRFALMASGVVVGEDDLVLHSCDNPPCVNPSHLRVGTNKENTGDMWARSRAAVNRRFGTRAPRVVLNDEKVAEARRMFALGGVSKAELGRRFGVSEGNMGAIIRGKTWRRPSSLVTERGRGK